MIEITNAIITGVITGLFSAGAVWGVIRTEMRFLRRDVDDLRNYIYPVHGEKRKAARNGN